MSTPHDPAATEMARELGALVAASERLQVAIGELIRLCQPDLDDGLIRELQAVDRLSQDLNVLRRRFAGQAQTFQENADEGGACDFFAARV
jgi:hypothetical protein